MEFNVEAKVKIYVDDPKNIASVKKSVEKLAKVQKFWEEDVGFGIKVLKAALLMNDSQGGMDKLEEQMRKVKGVSQMEVEEVSRI